MQQGPAPTAGTADRPRSQAKVHIYVAGSFVPSKGAAFAIVQRCEHVSPHDAAIFAHMAREKLQIMPSAEKMAEHYIRSTNDALDMAIWRATKLVLRTRQHPIMSNTRMEIVIHDERQDIAQHLETPHQQANGRLKRAKQGVNWLKVIGHEVRVQTMHGRDRDMDKAKELAAKLHHRVQHQDKGRNKRKRNNKYAKSAAQRRPKAAEEDDEDMEADAGPVPEGYRAAFNKGQWEMPVRTKTAGDTASAPAPAPGGMFSLVDRTKKR